MMLDELRMHSAPSWLPQSSPVSEGFRDDPSRRAAQRGDNNAFEFHLPQDMITVARLTISCISVRLFCLVPETGKLLGMRRIGAPVLAEV